MIVRYSFGAILFIYKAHTQSPVSLNTVRTNKGKFPFSEFQTCFKPSCARKKLSLCFLPGPRYHQFTWLHRVFWLLPVHFLLLIPIAGIQSKTQPLCLQPTSRETPHILPEFVLAQAIHMACALGTGLYCFSHFIS